MTSSWKFTGLAAVTASILCVQLLGFSDSELTHGFSHSRELGVVPSALEIEAKTRGNGDTQTERFSSFGVNASSWASVLTIQPAHAELSVAKATRKTKDVLVSQATNSRISFIPPATKNPRRSQGSGSRGCDNESLASNLVTLLIPSRDYAGQTLSGRPTFFWHLSKAVSVPMQFTLVEENVGGKTVLEKQIDAPKPGIIQVELPKDQPELVPGRIYRWTVSLVCNPNRRSEDVFFQSWIQRVPIAPELEQKLTTVGLNSTTLEPTQASEPISRGNESSQILLSRAAIYAQEGLWYDALTTLSTALNANPKDAAVQADFLSLLDQVGLSEVVQQERQRLAHR